jgi:hypothetical protein
MYKRKSGREMCWFILKIIQRTKVQHWRILTFFIFKSLIDVNNILGCFKGNVQIVDLFYVYSQILFLGGMIGSRVKAR